MASDKVKSLRGVVQDGVKDASKWLGMFASEYEAWLGERIFPGSLNIDTGEPFDWNDAQLLSFRRIFSLKPHGGERDIYIIPCTIVHPGRQKCWLWTTTRGAERGENKNIVELIASVKLRSELSLEIGSEIELEYPREWPT